MEAGFWLIVGAGAVAAAGIGFAAGRLTAPTQRRVDELSKERDSALSEAESVRKEVNRHFEESAQMFGKLAEDYRSFFQQFARTAQNLGLSEGHTRRLLQQADPSLITEEATPVRREGAGGPESPAASAAPEPDAGEARGPSAEERAEEAVAAAGAQESAPTEPADAVSPEPEDTERKAQAAEPGAAEPEVPESEVTETDSKAEQSGVTEPAAEEEQQTTAAETGTRRDG